MAYRIEVSDTADGEADQAYLWLSQRSPELAARWYQGLLEAYETLSEYPERCPLAPENAAFPDVEVRQLLYGRGRNAYRIRFCIVPADTVRILHVRHAARRRLGEQTLPQEEQDGSA
jgi:plasmid stabilization system protein ParE